MFGYVAYAHVNQGKLEPRAKRCMFVGYTAGVKGYKLWYKDGEISRSLISRDLIFREEEMYMSQGANRGEQVQAKQVAIEQVALEFQERSADQEEESQHNGQSQ